MEDTTRDTQGPSVKTHRYFQNTLHSSYTPLRYINNPIRFSVLNYLPVLLRDLLMSQNSLRQQIVTSLLCSSIYADQALGTLISIIRLIFLLLLCAIRFLF